MSSTPRAITAYTALQTAITTVLITLALNVSSAASPEAEMMTVQAARSDVVEIIIAP